MNFIEHIIEPQKLLLAWQSSDEKHRTRYIIGELNRVGETIDLQYLPKTSDYIGAKKHGFDAYPAFPDIQKTHNNVLDAFMRRLPPRTRGDFTQYLEGLRLKPDAKISNFALLGYSGAKLLSDGFSIIHPFNDVNGPCELLIEAAGYRHILNQSKGAIKIGDSAHFLKGIYEKTQEDEIRIEVAGNTIGYVNRALIPTFMNWIESGRISGAWVEKINGTTEKPVVYLYVRISSYTNEKSIHSPLDKVA